MKTKLRIVFAVSATLTAFAALAFVNNLVVVVRWWRAFLAAGGDTAGLSARVPGLIGWLDWSAVDYSAVTTLIPLLGLTCLTRAAARLLKGRTVAADDFPFFPGSDQLNVALGLFGTLWGIIVIGYFRLDTVTMADLMQCLHTALFSTLMAVVWVFLIDRPLVRPFFRRLLAATGLARVEEGDLAGAVDRLVDRLGAASDAFEARQHQFEAAFAARQREAEAAFAARQSEFEATFVRRQAELEEVAAKRMEMSDLACARRQEALADAVTRALEDLARVRDETTAHCAAQLSAYEKAFEARQQEYTTFFKREIERLEARAAAAESRLAAVSSALRS